MTIEGALVAAAMLAPPVMGYFFLRCGGRSPFGAARGAVLVLAVTVGIALGIAEFSIRHGIPLDSAMWLYPVVIGGIAVAVWQRPTDTR